MGLLTRVAAGAVVAAATGAVFGIALVILGVASKELAFGEAVAAVPQAAIVAGVFGLVLGMVPAALVITLTRARQMPWRAVPILLLGATIGIGCALAIAMLFPQTFAETGLLVLALGATAGGILASRLVR